MFATLKERRLLWPTLLTGIGLAILVSLGNWQMHRLAWKEALIARVNERAKADPVSIENALGIFTATHRGDVSEEIEFLRVAVKGVFRHEQEFHVWSPGKHGPAWNVVTPLRLTRPGQDADRRNALSDVLVIRGGVLQSAKDPASRAAGNPTGEVAFIGRVRLGRTGLFSNPTSAAKNEWYEFDLDSMRKATTARVVEGSGTADKASGLVAPFYIEAETSTGGPAGPQPELERVNLTNRHLEYVLTWYGLAATLLAVYLAFMRSRWRTAG